MKRRVLLRCVGWFLSLNGLALAQAPAVQAPAAQAPAARSSLYLDPEVCARQEFHSSCAYLRCASSDCDSPGEDFEALALIHTNQALAENEHRPGEVRFWARVILAHLFRVADRPVEAWLHFHKALLQNEHIHDNGGGASAQRTGAVEFLKKRLSLGKRTVHLLPPPGKSISVLTLNGVSDSATEWGDWQSASGGRQGPVLKLPPGPLLAEWQDNDQQCSHLFVITPPEPGWQALDLTCPPTPKQAPPPPPPRSAAPPSTTLVPPAREAVPWPLWSAWGTSLAATIGFGIGASDQESKSDEFFKRYEASRSATDRDKSAGAETRRNRLLVATAVSAGAFTTLSAWLLERLVFGESAAPQTGGVTAPSSKHGAAAAVTPRLQGGLGIDVSIRF